MRFIAVLVVAAACAPQPKPVQTRNDDDATRAVAELRNSRFPEAERAAAAALAKSPTSSTAAAVHAIARYESSATKLVRELADVLERGEDLRYFDHEKGRAIWLAFLADLDAIDQDLAIAAADPAFSLELCLACWEHDWNLSGEIDDRDRKFFELEFDGRGGELPEGDPRRRPTYRFDVGDAHWARAMIAFQRAAVQLVLGYRWSELDKLFAAGDPKIEIVLVDRGRVRAAHDLIIAGLAYADAERRAYLAETDDDREWVPNPRQKSYAMPLTVDDDLYATWAAVISDVQKMITSQEGVSLRDLGALVFGDDDASHVPAAYLDVGRMLREPRNIVVDFAALARTENYESGLRALLGNGYAQTMRASPLVARLKHMKETLDRGDDTFERKLRYLIWLN